MYNKSSNLTTLILPVCIIFSYLPPTVWQRQIICVVYYSEVERNNNYYTTRVQFNNSVHMLLTFYSMAETDDVW